MSISSQTRQALITALYLEFIHSTRNKVPDERVASLIGEQVRQHDTIQKLLQPADDISPAAAATVVGA